MRRLAKALPLVSLVAALACSSPCQDLATRICECRPPAERDRCRRAIEDQIDNGNPAPGNAEQDFCEAKLKTCPDPDDDRGICDRLETEEGQRACGLAFDVPAQ